MACHAHLLNRLRYIRASMSGLDPVAAAGMVYRHDRRPESSRARSHRRLASISARAGFWPKTSMDVYKDGSPCNRG